MNDKLDKRLQRLANSTNKTFTATFYPEEHGTHASLQWHGRSPRDNDGKGVPVTGSQASASDAIIKTYRPGGGTTDSGATSSPAYNAPIGNPATGNMPATSAGSSAASGPYMTSARGAAQQYPQRDNTAASTRAPALWFADDP